MKHTVVLIVLDGWGIGQENESNPIHVIKPRAIEYLRNNFPSGSLQASGIAVGLPWGEEGNSEVGHLTMGIGRIMYQHYPRISLAIKDGSFQQNKAVLDAFEHAKKNGSKVNFVGLVGQGNIHSSLEHVHELIRLADEHQVPFALHLFTDGRDSDPNAAFSTLSQFPVERIASISGRYYAMDRDKHWDLTQKAYAALTGTAPIIAREDMKKHIEATYAKKLNDEFVAPAVVGSADMAIKDNDAVFFFNFREDRMRQIGEAIANPYFSEFPAIKFQNLYVASMTQLREDFTIPVAFPPETISSSLGKVLSEAGKSQLRIAETQKYAHVTFFFNGLNDKPFPNEYRVLIPSRMAPRQDEDPVMMAPAIAARIIQGIEEGAFDFILANFANPDMIAHTGNYEAAKKAIQVIDEQLQKILTAAAQHDVTLLITSDHGNAERLFDPQTGQPETKHDANPVPLYLVSRKYFRPQRPDIVQEREHFTIGMLSDIAPTILELMGIQKPHEMTGESLLRQLL
jgi:2,3-bisphosphoglycerate-independent phosphoglycerate mutase